MIGLFLNKIYYIEQKKSIFNFLKIQNIENIILFILLCLNFKKIDKAELKIDLVDAFGERAFAFNKGDTYSNLYLADKQCYELHKINFNKGN